MLADVRKESVVARPSVRASDHEQQVEAAQDQSAPVSVAEVPMDVTEGCQAASREDPVAGSHQEAPFADEPESEQQGLQSAQDAHNSTAAPEDSAEDASGKSAVSARCLRHTSAGLRASAFALESQALYSVPPRVHACDAE